MILGIIIALLSPVKYTSSTIFVPQISSSVNNSNLSTIASIAGFKLDNNISNNEISPNIYPLIINSYNFKNQLLNTQISLGNNIKLKEYLLNISDSPLKILYNYTFGLPTYLKKIIKNIVSRNEDDLTLNKKSNLLSISIEEKKLHNILSEIIFIDVNQKEGYISLSSKINNPEVAASITQNSLEILQNEIINYKIKNAKEILKFSVEEFNKKKLELEKTQDEIAILNDKNKNVNSSLLANQITRLQSKLSIDNIVYQELAKQVENSKLKVSKETPIFIIIEPVVIPNQKSEPNTTNISISFLLIGFILSCLYYLFKDKIQQNILILK